MKYLINNRFYQITSKYIPEEELHESTLTPDDGGPAEEIKIFGYGDTEKESVRSLKERLWEKGILENINNYYLSWENLDSETRRKIIVYMKGIKSELMGEWMTDEERYTIWKKKVESWTSQKYGYTTPPTYGDYRRL